MTLEQEMHLHSFAVLFHQLAMSWCCSAGEVANYPEASEAGGLSGPPLMELSTGVLADMYRLTGHGGWGSSTIVLFTVLFCNVVGVWGGSTLRSCFAQQETATCVPHRA
jgi:hypothetical protein